VEDDSQDRRNPSGIRTVIVTASRRTFLKTMAIGSAGVCTSANASILSLLAASAQRPRVARAGLSRYDRLRSARVAPGPITDVVLRRQTEAGLNAAMLTDLGGWDAAARGWRRADEATIAQQLELARQYDLSVFVEIPAVVVVPPATAGESNGLVQLSDSEFRERIGLWSRYAREEIIGVFFVTDDPFLLEIAATDLERWSSISRQTAPELPILGLAGEYVLPMTAQQRAVHWAPAAYDGLLLLNYPYNLGGVWGHPLDHQKSPDPDGALAAYESAYIEAMRQALLKDLQPQQIVVPVIQTFYYTGDAPGSIPRQRDIEIQSRLVHAAMQNALGQGDNYAMGYYYDGPDEQPYPFAIPRGIDSVPSWSETIAGENAWLEAEFSATLRPSRRRAARH
jgi:hypothetical protein